MSAFFGAVAILFGALLQMRAVLAESKDVWEYVHGDKDPSFGWVASALVLHPRKLVWSAAARPASSEGKELEARYYKMCRTFASWAYVVLGSLLVTLNASEDWPGLMSVAIVMSLFCGVMGVWTHFAKARVAAQ